MKDNIKIFTDKHNIFIDTFLGEYLSRGFGSMSKRDMDVLIMHLLMELSDLDNESNFSLSIKLKLTESKIKNLKYEANLKYSKNLENSIKREFLLLLNKAKLKVIGREPWISIVVEDSFLRNAIKAKVKENGSFADSSFNSEIVKISVEDFSYLMYEFSNEKERESTRKVIVKLFSDKNTLEFKELFQQFIQKAIEGAGNEIGRQGIKLGVTYLSGGTSVLGQIFNTLKAYVEPIIIEE